MRGPLCLCCSCSVATKPQVQEAIRNIVKRTQMFCRLYSCCSRVEMLIRRQFSQAGSGP